MKLENKVCIVTGAARGIGEGIAKRYSRPTHSPASRWW